MSTREYSEEELPPPDEIYLAENEDYQPPAKKVDPSSGQVPPGFGDYPNGYDLDSTLPDYISPDEPVSEEEDIVSKFAKSFKAHFFTEESEQAVEVEKSLIRVLKSSYPYPKKIDLLKTLLAVSPDARSTDQILQVLGPLQDIQDRMIEKVYEGLVQRITKSADGKHFFVSGTASDNKIDFDGEKMSDACIESIARQLKQVNFYADHKHGINDLLGAITESYVKDGKVFFTARLEDPEQNPLVASLISKLDSGMRLGTSIGGMPLAHHYERINGREIKVYDDVDLLELSATPMPSNSRAKIGLLYRKSLQTDRTNN